jgi:hypothetical protein
MLHLTDEPARTFRAASRAQGWPVISLTTDDCAGEAERLKARGVVFVKEPGRMDYGAWTRCSTTPATTSSTSTRTDTGASRDGPHPRGPGASMGPLLASNLTATTRKELR